MRWYGVVSTPRSISTSAPLMPEPPMSTPKMIIAFSTLLVFGSSQAGLYAWAIIAPQQPKSGYCTTLPMLALLLEELGDQAGPACLVAGAHATAIVAME